MRYEDLRELLKGKREEKGLTQAGVADMIEVSRPLVGHWESGEKVPTVDGLQRWAAALGVPVEFAVGAHPVVTPSLARAVAVLARVWDNLSSTQQSAVLTVIELSERPSR